MQQRRLRLGDILDDYCPRERRITNHAVVAMIDDAVKQTRCTTCDADHEYKQARVPTPRHKKAGAALVADGSEGVLRPRPVHHDSHEAHEGYESHEGHEEHEEHEEHEDSHQRAAAEPLDSSPAETPAADSAGEAEIPTAPAEDEGPVHRRLIRATLPRPEGQAPERKNPDFTIRQPGGRGFDGNNGPHRGGRGRRPMRAHDGAPGQPTRFGGGGGGGQRHGTGPRHGSGQAQRHQGNRPGHPGGNRGQGRGPGGGGRKRGR